MKNVRPWDVFVWKKFIEKHVVPLKALGNIVTSYFAGDPGAEVAKSLATTVSRVIEVATRVVDSVKEEFIEPSNSIRCTMQYKVFCIAVFTC